MSANDAVIVLEDGKMSIRNEVLARAFIDQYVKTLYPQAQHIVAARAVTPRIGEVWESQGGIYAGTVRGDEGQPDYHLVLHKDERESIQWQPAMDWAAALELDGHQDFKLPTRREQAILYGNLKDQFKPEWHWSCEQPASGPGYAWMQYFDNGIQYTGRKDSNYRARAVRRVI